MCGLSSTPSNGVQPAAVRERLRVALLTPAGRGALAVVGVRGPEAAADVDALFLACGGRPFVEREDAAICFGTWRPTGEEVVVVRLARERVEVHCHGGMAASAAVIASLEAAGAERVSWRQWLAMTSPSQSVAEAREALALAGGPKAARILARQAAGALDRELARIEAVAAVGQATEARQAAARLLAAARVGLRLTKPWRIVLSGQVNAGKSSLVNALVGHDRTIVSPQPGTTRDAVATRAVLDGWEVEIVDVAGIRGAEDAVSAVEQAGIARAAAERMAADLVLRIVPADRALAGFGSIGANELVVISKGDLAPALLDPDAVITSAVVTSAVTGFGIEPLAGAIIDRLVPEERRDPSLLAAAVPITERQVAVVESLASRA